MQPGTDTPEAGAREKDVARVLVENYTRFLAFLEKRVDSRELAEDLLQDAFVRGVGRARTIRRDESVVAWFYRVLRNTIADHYRRMSAEARAHGRVASAADPFEPGPDEELRDQVCGCVNDLVETLKPEYARALRRVDLEEADVRTWAGEEGITPNNAAVRLHRARGALRRQVIRTCGTCADHACLDCPCKVGSGLSS